DHHGPCARVLAPVAPALEAPDSAHLRNILLVFRHPPRSLITFQFGLSRMSKRAIHSAVPLERVPVSTVCSWLIFVFYLVYLQPYCPPNMFSMVARETKCDN